ncbi:MAG TPA: phytanoyl-CoA dioxygenase family protein [Bacilli bacterium]
MATEFKMDFSQYELTEVQKFLFDLKGYIVFPNVFTGDQVSAMKEQVEQINQEKQNRSAAEQKAGIVQGSTIPGGPSEVILSNPIVKGTLHHLIGPDIRLDQVFSVVREKGQGDTQGPHQGGPMRNPHFHYHFTQGQSYSGLTRMVVELNSVGKDDGGTVFLPGSHKANLPVPASFREHKDTYSSPFEGYEAPAGSVVFFSENTCHAGPVWNNPNHSRVAILFAFCNIGMRWHRYSNVTPEVIEKLGPEARWYFRDIWPWDNTGANGGRNQLLVNEDGTYIVSP